MLQPSHNGEWKHIAHNGLHVLKHVMENEQSKALLKKAVETVAAVARAVPVLVPVLAIGAGITSAIWWWKKC